MARSPGLRRGATSLRPFGAIQDGWVEIPRLTPWGYFLTPFQGYYVLFRGDPQAYAVGLLPYAPSGLMALLKPSVSSGGRRCRWNPLYLS